MFDGMVSLLIERDIEDTLTRLASPPCAAASCARRRVNAALIWSNACVVDVDRGWCEMALLL